MVRPLTKAETAHNQCAWKRETGNVVSVVAKRQALDTWTSRLPVLFGNQGPEAMQVRMKRAQNPREATHKTGFLM